MAVNEQARHRLYQRLEEVLGPDEAGILMEHLPPRGFGDLATKGDLDLLRSATKGDLDLLRGDMDALRSEVGLLRRDLERLRDQAATKSDLAALRHELTARIDRSARQLMMWVSGMVLATGGLAFTAGRFV